MVNLTLVKPNNDVLKKACEKFDFANPPFDPLQFSTDLVETMHLYEGLGLAANQVGISYAIFAMQGFPQNYVFFNPRIVNISDEKATDVEGCLSFAGISLEVERSHSCRIRFQGPDGETYTKEFHGLSARVIQHEMEHLHGTNFLTKVSKLKAEMALKKAKKKYGFPFQYHEVTPRKFIMD